MVKGVVYKCNGSTWSKSVVKDTSNGTGTTYDEGFIQHYSATEKTWHENYPMEQLYEAYFNAQWTQGYKYATGQILDTATWGDHPRCGDATANFCGLWGFDRAAMQAFVADGVVQDIQIEVMFDDPSHAGNPYVYFFPHVYTSKPSSWSGYNANSTYKTYSQFNQTGADYTRWIKLPVGAWLGGSMGGVVVHADATAANSARFAGKTTSHSLNGFNTRLWIQVLK
jgi:hypothetical protein